MLDLRAVINVIPYFIYAYLNLGPLKKIGVVIQPADQSSSYPMGVMKNVLVHVGNLVFSVDFYVLDMNNEESLSKLPLLLRRPFMKTIQTKIDVQNGSLTMEFDGEIESFKVLE